MRPAFTPASRATRREVTAAYPSASITRSVASRSSLRVWESNPPVPAREISRAPFVFDRGISVGTDLDRSLLALESEEASGITTQELGPHFWTDLRMQIVENGGQAVARPWMRVVATQQHVVRSDVPDGFGDPGVVRKGRDEPLPTEELRGQEAHASLTFAPSLVAREPAPQA